MEATVETGVVFRIDAALKKKRPSHAAAVVYKSAPMPPIISVQGLSKTYASGFEALKSVDLEIERGEIFTLLGPNGAGKTTLISIICGIVNPSAGRVMIDGHDITRISALPGRRSGWFPRS